jgi:3-hydroxyacyl-[acyl-carrier-protein] dehydratase
MLATEFIIAVDHPALPGHFPGHPIVPGVVTLDQVAQALLAQLPELELAGFPQVKFMRPVLPAKPVVVSFTRKNDSLFQFQCRLEGELALTGQIRLRPKEARLG